MTKVKSKPKKHKRAAPKKDVFLPDSEENDSFFVRTVRDAVRAHPELYPEGEEAMVAFAKRLDARNPITLGEVIDSMRPLKPKPMFPSHS